jgi:hypothetical protein
MPTQCCKLLSKIIKEGRFILKSRKITWVRQLDGKRLWNRARGQIKTRSLLQKWVAQRKSKALEEVSPEGKEVVSGSGAGQDSVGAWSGSRGLRNVRISRWRLVNKGMRCVYAFMHLCVYAFMRLLWCVYAFMRGAWQLIYLVTALSRSQSQSRSQSGSHSQARSQSRSQSRSQKIYLSHKWKPQTTQYGHVHGHMSHVTVTCHLSRSRVMRGVQGWIAVDSWSHESEMLIHSNTLVFSVFIRNISTKKLCNTFFFLVDHVEIFFKHQMVFCFCIYSNMCVYLCVYIYIYIHACMIFLDIL